MSTTPFWIRDDGAASAFGLLEADPVVSQFKRECRRPAYVWFRVEIGTRDRQRHFVDVEAYDDGGFDATRGALEQNKHANWAKVVRKYYPGEKLLGSF